MLRLDRVSLRTRLVVLAILLVLVPLVIAGILSVRQSGEMQEIAAEECLALAGHGSCPSHTSP